MFNTYHAGNHSLNINAVSGTLVKNHPKSLFVVAEQDSLIFNSSKPQLPYRGDRGYWEHADIIVLQAMLLPSGNFLCEVVRKDDFEEVVKNDNYVCRSI